MADRTDHLFEVVRKGYDVDEVKRYLDELNGWWKAELEQAVGERDRRIAELEEMTADVAAARSERDSLARMLDDAAEQRAHMLEEAEQKASRLVADTEHEMAKLRRDTESALARLRSEADTKKDEKLSSASAEARSMIEQAKATIASMEKQSQRWLTDEELATRARIDSLSQSADRKHKAKLRHYARLENELSSHIQHLQTVRDSLIASLEAIARGALHSAGEVAEPLPMDPAPFDLDAAPVDLDGLDDPQLDAPELGDPELDDDASIGLSA